MSRGFLVSDYVADVRVRAWGLGFEEVFSEMSKGMWSVMFGEARIPALDKWNIEVTGADMEDLLVAFLNEQLALFDMEGLAVADIERIDIRPVKLGPGREGEEVLLDAAVSGAHVSQVQARVNLHIKAATFHGLRLTPTEAWITFDV